MRRGRRRRWWGRSNFVYDDHDGVDDFWFVMCCLYGVLGLGVSMSFSFSSSAWQNHVLSLQSKALVSTRQTCKRREAYFRHVQIVGGNTDVVAPLIASLICNGVQPHKRRKRVDT